jgi:hypothetical protein
MKNITAITRIKAVRARFQSFPKLNLVSLSDMRGGVF